jgi:hypothetical protein
MRWPSGGASSLLLCAVLGCAARRPPAPASVPPTRPFILTFWCGPPLAEIDDDRAAEIATAGFNVIGAPCEGDLDRADTLRALDVAQRHGLRMWVADHRLGAPGAGFEQRVASVVADYARHPALEGYFLRDEPVAADFAALASLVAALRRDDPRHPAYVNLLPDYVPVENLGTDTYEDYLERFVAEVRPRLLSYDYYPFGEKKDRSTFFANLAAVRAIALRHDLPFLLIVQAMPHGPYRDPNEAELRWQVFHALAYGARGVSYFAYWTPPADGDFDFHDGLIENGRPTLHYFEAARINRDLRALAAALAPYRSLGVADSAGEIGVPFPIGPIEAVEGGPVSAGLFADRAGRLAVLLVNRDYRQGITAALRLREGAGWPQVFDPQAGLWRRTDRAIFPMAPGDARLLRWE